jgi:hypothetical protein
MGSFGGSLKRETPLRTAGRQVNPGSSGARSGREGAEGALASQRKVFSRLRHDDSVLTRSNAWAAGDAPRAPQRRCFLALMLSLMGRVGAGRAGASWWGQGAAASGAQRCALRAPCGIGLCGSPPCHESWGVACFSQLIRGCRLGSDEGVCAAIGKCSVFGGCRHTLAQLPGGDRRGQMQNRLHKVTLVTTLSCSPLQILSHKKPAVASVSLHLPPTFSSPRIADTAQQPQGSP